MNDNAHFLKAIPIPIRWNPGLPVFAKESFLKAVGDEYGWLGGFSRSGELRCILPYTVVRRGFFRMVRLRVETIPQGAWLELDDERSFLNSAMGYFHSIRADMVIPPSNNAVFRTYPDGADAAPYGSYVIDLTQSEDVLWRNIDRIVRQNINSARKKGVQIFEGINHTKPGHQLIAKTFKRSGLPFMSYPSFLKYIEGLGESGLLLRADYEGSLQSFVVFAFSRPCAYAIYAGNCAHQLQGANKFLYWEAIRHFNQLGIARYDFMGARIDPERGSKQEEINLLKKRFGAELKRGFIWKQAIHPLRYRCYGLAARLRTGGDIVDAERHKLTPPRTRPRGPDEAS
jgi:hypothetical protein